MNKTKLSSLCSFSRSSFNIIDYNSFKTTSFSNKIRDKIQTKFTLNKMASMYGGFEKSTIINKTEEIYIDFLKCLKNKDKITMMKLISFPFHNFIDKSLKNNYLLNYDKNPIVKKKEIMSARSYSNKVFDPNSYNTWFQISIKLNIVDNGVEKDRIVVVEKRECDLKDEDWRICLID